MAIGINSSYNETGWGEIALGEEIDVLKEKLKRRERLLLECLEELKSNKILKRNNLIKRIENLKIK